MRRLACLAFAACSLGSPALARPADAPSAEDVARKQGVTVAAGAAMVPDYDGSDDYRLIPAIALRGQVHRLSTAGGSDEGAQQHHA